MRAKKIIGLWTVAFTLLVIFLINRDYFLLNLLSSTAFFVVVGLALSLVPFRMISYKRKTIVVIPVVMLLFSLFCLFGSFFSEYGLFSPYNYFTAKSDLKKGKVQLIRPGLIRGNVEQQERGITCKYGFNYVNSGCIISDKGYVYYNAVITKYLTRINSEGWRDRLNRELDSLHKTENQN
jgi:hypothetical protein